MKHPTFIAYADKTGEWRWRLVAKNSRIIADSGEAYTRKHDCLRAIELVKIAAFCSVVDTVDDAANR